jgi:hypothetical protein
MLLRTIKMNQRRLALILTALGAGVGLYFFGTQLHNLLTSRHGYSSPGLRPSEQMNLPIPAPTSSEASAQADSILPPEEAATIISTAATSRCPWVDSTSSEQFRTELSTSVLQLFKPTIDGSTAWLQTHEGPEYERTHSKEWITKYVKGTQDLLRASNVDADNITVRSPMTFGVKAPSRPSEYEPFQVLSPRGKTQLDSAERLQLTVVEVVFPATIRIPDGTRKKIQVGVWLSSPAGRGPWTAIRYDVYGLDVSDGFTPSLF